MEERKLAQPQDEMFQRNVAVLASKKREVQVTTPSGKWVGYLTGLDEFTLQVYLSEEKKYVLVSREGTLAIEETGKSFYNEKKRGVYSLEELEILERRIKHFSSLAEHYTSSRKGVSTNGGSGEQWEDLQPESS